MPRGTTSQKQVLRSKPHLISRSSGPGMVLRPDAARMVVNVRLDSECEVLVMTAESYMDAVRDERVLNQLKAAIRAMPQLAASARIVEIYAANSRIGMRVANACSRDRSVFRYILLDGLSRADLSTVRQWMKCVVPRLGVVATVNAIMSIDNYEPVLGETCIYWIESMRLRLSRRELSALANLKEVMRGRKASVSEKGMS